MSAYVARLFADDELDVEVWQKRPYTAVKAKVVGHPEDGFGFSKVCWPDEWDEERGIEAATIKALHDLACALVDADAVVPE